MLNFLSQPGSLQPPWTLVTVGERPVLKKPSLSSLVLKREAGMSSGWTGNPQRKSCLMREQRFVCELLSSGMHSAARVEAITESAVATSHTLRPCKKYGCRVLGSHTKGPLLLHRGSAFFCVLKVSPRLSYLPSSQHLPLSISQSRQT